MTKTVKISADCYELLKAHKEAKGVTMTYALEQAVKRFVKVKKGAK